MPSTKGVHAGAFVKPTNHHVFKVVQLRTVCVCARYVDGLMAPKCCRLCATSFVPFFKKPEFNDDPVANMAVFTPRADNMGHTLPKIYTGLAFLEESLQEDPRRSSEMREGLLLRQTQLRPPTRQVFVDDVDDLGTGVAPSIAKNNKPVGNGVPSSVRKKKNFAGFVRDTRLSGYEAVEVFPDHPVRDRYHRKPRYSSLFYCLYFLRIQGR